MTVRGMFYLTAAALVTLLAVGTGIRELFLLCLFLWILGGLLLLSALAALLRLRLAERLDRPAVIRGEEAMLHVEAAGFVACPVLLEWRVITPDGERHRCILTVLPGRRGRRYWLKFACPHRGPYTIGAEKVRVLDLLGLFSLPLLPASSRVPAPLPLLVYPVVEPAGDPAESAGGVQTAQEAADGVCDHGDTFADTRLYREGDSLGKIHWTQSLRTRTLYTRQYERQSPSPVWLLLDPVVPLGLDPAAYGDRLCDALASAAWRFVRQGRPVCLTLLGGAGDPVSADSEQTFGCMTGWPPCSSRRRHCRTTRLPLRQCRPCPGRTEGSIRCTPSPAARMRVCSPICGSSARPARCACPPGRPFPSPWKRWPRGRASG